MAKPRANDNHLAPTGDRMLGSQPEAQAAFLLAESLLHGLVAGSHLSVAEAIEIVGVAADVVAEHISDRGDPDGSLRRSHLSLASISASLAIDLPS